MDVTDMENVATESYWDELCVDHTTHFLSRNIATNHLVAFHNKIVFECFPYPSLALYGQCESSVNADYYSISFHQDSIDFIPVCLCHDTSMTCQTSSLEIDCMVKLHHNWLQLNISRW